MVIKWNGGGLDRPRSYPEGKMPYLVMKSCVYSGGALSAGDVVEIENKEAAALESMGRIQKYDGPVEEPAPVVDRRATPRAKRTTK